MAIQYQQPLDRTFHALGDGTRRQILTLLANNGPQSANTLRAPFDVAQPTISKHLKVLEQAGLIKREVVGRTHQFQLNVSTLTDAQNWIAQHKTLWEGTLQSLEAFMTDPADPENQR